MITTTTTFLRRALVAVLATAMGPHGSARAGTDGAGAGSITRVTLAADTDIPRGATVDLLRRTMTLAAGEKRHLRGRLEATSKRPSPTASRSTFSREPRRFRQEAHRRGARGARLWLALIGWIFGLLNWLDLCRRAGAGVVRVDLRSRRGRAARHGARTAQHGRRDFSSVRSVVPSRYEVVTDAEVGDEAARLAAKLSGSA